MDKVKVAVRGGGGAGREEEVGVGEEGNDAQCPSTRDSSPLSCFMMASGRSSLTCSSKYL